MKNTEIITEIERLIAEGNLIIFNEETRESLSGSDIECIIAMNGSAIQITLNKEQVLKSRGSGLTVIVQNGI